MLEDIHRTNIPVIDLSPYAGDNAVNFDGICRNGSNWLEVRAHLVTGNKQERW